MRKPETEPDKPEPADKKVLAPHELSRRSFIRGMLVGAGASAALATLTGFWAYEHPSTVADLFGQNALADGTPYHDANWQGLDIAPSTVPLIKFNRDPQATSDQRTWKNLGMLSIATASMQQAQAKAGHGFIPAVTFNDGTHLTVGYDPSGGSFFRPNPHDPSTEIVGMAVGPGDLLAAACVYNPQTEVIAMPDASTISLGEVAKVKLAALFPGAVWI